MVLTRQGKRNPRSDPDFCNNAGPEAARMPADPPGQGSTATKTWAGMGAAPGGGNRPGHVRAPHPADPHHHHRPPVRTHHSRRGPVGYRQAMCLHQPSHPVRCRLRKRSCARTLLQPSPADGEASVTSRIMAGRGASLAAPQDGWLPHISRRTAANFRFAVNRLPGPACRPWRHQRPRRALPRPKSPPCRIPARSGHPGSTSGSSERRAPAPPGKACANQSADGAVRRFRRFA